MLLLISKTRWLLFRFFMQNIVTFWLQNVKLRDRGVCIWMGARGFPRSDCARVCARVRVCAVHDFELLRCYVQFKFGFVLYCKRSSNHLNFPLGWIRYHTMLCYWLLGDWQPGTSYSLHYSHFHLLFLLCTNWKRSLFCQFSVSFGACGAASYGTDARLKGRLEVGAWGTVRYICHGE